MSQSLITRPVQSNSIHNQESFSIHSAQNDQQLIDLWLHSEGRRSKRTRIEYGRDVQSFQDHSGLLLKEVSLDVLLGYQRSLSDLSSSAQSRRMASLKSLLSFAHKVGYLPFDVGQVVGLPPIENKLSERILSEEELFRILSLETNPRNLLLLKLFYVSAGRVSEVCALRWRNLQSNGDSGQITFFGKGGKTRAVKLPEGLWKQLIEHKNDICTQSGDAIADQESQNEQPVFVSQKKTPLSKSQMWRIVRAAALRAGIGRNVSPHWFRHAHISHALDNGAPVHLVQQTAGHSSLSTTSRYTHAKPSESSSSYLKIK